MTSCFSEKMMFPTASYVVSCPTCTKNLEWYLMHMYIVYLNVLRSGFRIYSRHRLLWEKSDFDHFKICRIEELRSEKQILSTHYIICIAYCIIVLPVMYVWVSVFWRSFSAKSLENADWYIQQLDLSSFIDSSLKWLVEFRVGQNSKPQSPFDKVMQCALLMKQNLRFGLIWANWAV